MFFQQSELGKPLTRCHTLPAKDFIYGQRSNDKDTSTAEGLMKILTMLINFILFLPRSTNISVRGGGAPAPPVLKTRCQSGNFSKNAENNTRMNELRGNVCFKNVCYN